MSMARITAGVIVFGTPVLLTIVFAFWVAAT